MDTLNSLKEKLNRLEDERAALRAQSKLLESFVGMARTAEKDEMLAAILQQTLDISADLTGAEKGGIFLLDSKGLVTNSILTRGEESSEQRSLLIGTVLDKGLAGWVSRHRKVGLIVDTEKDDRWLKLPNQPYTAGSALAVPILRGKDLVGLLTLLHTRPGHFTEESADLMRLTAVQIAVALENARLSKTEKIIVYCHVGSRSAHCQRILSDMGYENVGNLTYGIVAYGGELER